jgi:hypothetical protein
VRRGAARAAAAIALVLVTRADAEQPSDVDRDAARALVQQGDELVAKREYEAALEAYRHADEIMGVPTTAVEVGKTLLLLGRMVEAKTAFERGATHQARPDEPEPFARAREECARRAAELEKHIPTLTVLVAGAEPGVTIAVRLDDKLLQSRTGLRVDPGRHEVVATAPGYEHTVVTFELADGERRTVDVAMEEAAPPMWPLAIAGFSVAGAGVIVGAITGGLSLQAAAEVDDLCDDSAPRLCQPEAEDVENRRVALGHTSTVSFAVAGVGAVVGVVALVLSLELDDAVGADAGGLSLRF